MPDLATIAVERRSPLAHPIAASVPACVISALAAETRLQVRIREGDLPRGVEIGGVSLDAPINTRRVLGDRASLRLGPNEWLLSGPEAARSAMEADAAAALAGVFHVVVDVSHRHFGLAIEGAKAIDALNAGCPLDLDVRAFPTGMATRTLLGKAEVILARTGDAPRFEILCWRSYARYLDAFLAEAAATA